MIKQDIGRLIFENSESIGIGDILGKNLVVHSILEDVECGQLAQVPVFYVMVLSGDKAEKKVWRKYPSHFCIVEYL